MVARSRKTSEIPQKPWCTTNFRFITRRQLQPSARIGHVNEQWKLKKEIQADAIFGMPIDTTIPKYTFTNKYKVFIPERKEFLLVNRRPKNG